MSFTYEGAEKKALDTVTFTVPAGSTVALARDSRLKGEDFQKVAAGVMAANVCV